MNRIVAIVLIGLCGMSSCKKDDEIDFNAQLAKDVATIDAYLDTQGIDAIEDPSGVRYVITEVGTGFKPTLESKVSVKYKATLLGSSVPFDSTKNGVVLELTTLIKSWQIVLPLMNKGSKFIIYTPSGLAYGSTGVVGVPANSNIIFEIELLDDDAQLAADIIILNEYVDSLAVALDLDIIKDPRGFAYNYVTLGDGPKPVSTSLITVRYTGKLMKDNSTFATQNSPVQVPMAQLMEGWQLALPLINQGSVFTLYLPSGMAYGPSGYGDIEPNENVIFDITLESIN